MRANESHVITVDNRAVEVTHPEKVLFRYSGVTKIELVEYYLSVADPLLHYAKNRPLSYKRFPNGFPGDFFFQRNKPKRAPAWVKSQLLGINRQADYILPQHITDFLYLVNLDSLEFHIVQTRAPHFYRPDSLVFDLDPPHDSGESLYEHFQLAKDLAFRIKPILEGLGYYPFAKTSGKKGIHIFCPILPQNSYDEVFEKARQIGEIITQKIPSTTLRIAKEKRLDKTLVDIYRNHTLQSMSMPYGTRATDQGTVSMPLSWKTLENLQTPEVFTVGTVPEYLAKYDDAWKDMQKHVVGLH